VTARKRLEHQRFLGPLQTLEYGV